MNPSAQPPPAHLPDLIRSEEELDELLSRPSVPLFEFVRTLVSPLLVLGAGGKMGPTLAVMAKRAAVQAGHPLEVIAVSRFSDPRAREWLQSRGVATLASDLLDREAVQRLPASTNLVYLVGVKFGTRQNPALTWAANTLVPAWVMERYTGARLVALSTGNVYPQVPMDSGGSQEQDALTPLGEYANSAVARERLFEFFSLKNGTRAALIRLNYAVELRYGVLVDIARKVLEEEPIDLANGYLNCIWQGDANELILRALSLAATPAAPWNLTGPERLGVRALAERFGELLGRRPRFVGSESPTALLSNPGKLVAALGAPATPLNAVVRWTAQWVRTGGRLLNKPTHFEVKDGNY